MKTKPQSNHSFASVIIKMTLIIMLGLGAWLSYEIVYLQPADNWFEIKAKTSSSVNLPKDDAPHLAKWNGGTITGIYGPNQVNNSAFTTQPLWLLSS